MSFRRRMVLLAAGAVAAAVVLASVVVYVATRNELIAQTDSSLREKLIPGEPQSVQIRSTEAERSGDGEAQAGRRIAPADVHADRRPNGRIGRRLEQAGLWRSTTIAWGIRLD